MPEISIINDDNYEYIKYDTRYTFMLLNNEAVKRSYLYNYTCKEYKEIGNVPKPIGNINYLVTYIASNSRTIYNSKDDINRKIKTLLNFNYVYTIVMFDINIDYRDKYIFTSDFDETYKIMYIGDRFSSNLFIFTKNDQRILKYLAWYYNEY